MDSLLKGNPVGILLLWRSKNPKDSDPFALRVLVGEDKGSENFLIVDGQQRVLCIQRSCSALNWRSRGG